MELKEACSLIAASLRTIADLVELVGDSIKPKEIIEIIPDNLPEPEHYSLEYVVAYLTSLATNGYKQEVKALIKKYGYAKLSAIQEKDADAIIKEAEVIANAAK